MPVKKFPLTPRKDGRWMKKVRDKFYYFRGSKKEALAQWHALEPHLSKSDGDMSPTEEAAVTRHSGKAGQLIRRLVAEIRTLRRDNINLRAAVARRDRSLRRLRKTRKQDKKSRIASETFLTGLMCQRPTRTVVSDTLKQLLEVGG